MDNHIERIIAVAGGGNEVAPTFDFTDAVTLFKVTQRDVQQVAIFSMRGLNLLERVALLDNNDVNSLLCYSISRGAKVMIEHKNIDVVAQMQGPCCDVLGDFQKNCMFPSMRRGRCLRRGRNRM